jgi:membrane protein implicated in regulation of membrane protease activity
MTPSTLFIDSDGGLDDDEIIREAIPVAALLARFILVAFVPFAVAVFFARNSMLGFLLTLAAQFILAVGAAITLLYVIDRAHERRDQRQRT